MILLFWFLGWLWVQCYLTDRFSTACENFSIWGSQQSNIELATYICTTHTLHTNNTRSPTASSLCRVSGCGKWNYSPSYREESFYLSLPLFLTFLLLSNRTELKARLAGIVSLCHRMLRAKWERSSWSWLPERNISSVCHPGIALKWMMGRMSDFSPVSLSLMSFSLVYLRLALSPNGAQIGFETL